LNIPIKSIPKPEQKPFVELVDQIIAITKTDNYLSSSDKQAQIKEYEHQIDQMIYELYRLTPEEIEIVEGKSESR